MRFSSMPTSSSALVLGASVASLLSAPAGVMGGPVPDPCPPSCESAIQGWTEHHRLTDASACHKNLRYDVVFNKETNKNDIHACVIEGLSTGSSVSRRSGSAEALAEKEVDFQIGRKTDGVALTKAELDFYTSCMAEVLDEERPGGASFFISCERSDMNGTITTYISEGVNPRSLSPLIAEFGEKLVNGSSLHLAQYCGEGVPNNQTIGIVMDSTKASVDGIAQSWFQGDCTADFQAEETWANVPVTFRD